jgi:hypothetical protein
MRPYVPLQTQNDENNCNIESLQLYVVATAGAVLEIGTAAVSSALSFDKHVSQKNTSCVSRCRRIVVLFGACC